MVMRRRRLSALSISPAGAPNRQTDKAAIERAVLDYVEGIYDVEPERVVRSVDPKLAKLGFGRWEDDEVYRSFAMTYEQLVDLAPVDPSVSQIPPLPLRVFDPDQGRYVTVTTEPIPIRVRALAGAARSSSSLCPIWRPISLDPSLRESRPCSSANPSALAWYLPAEAHFGAQPLDSSVRRRGP